MSSIKHFLNNDERIIRKYKEKMIKRGHSENEFDNSVEWMKNLDNFEFLSIGLNGEEVTPPSIRINKPCDNANMDAYIGRGTIRVSPPWIERLLTGGLAAKLAYKSLLSHEHVHQYKWIPARSLSLTKRIFILWFNECYADVKGHRKAFGDNKAHSMIAVEYNIQNASKMGLVHSTKHPSWEFRKKLIERGVFDEVSIQMIQNEVEEYRHKKLDTEFVKKVKSEIAPYFVN